MTEQPPSFAPSPKVLRLTRRGLNVVLASAGLLLCACPDGSDPSVDTDPTSDDGSTGAPLTTSSATMATMDGSVDSTGGPTDDGPASSTSDSDTGVASTSGGDSGTADSGTSGDSDTSAGSETTGGPAQQGYGDCANNPVFEVCDPAFGELCNPGQGFGSLATGACASQTCVDPVADCPPGPPGFAEPACVTFSPNEYFCALDCSDGSPCPDGMTCFVDFWCTWLTVPPGGGSCIDAIPIDGADVPLQIMGDTTGQFDDHLPYDAFVEAEDQVVEFTAGAAGQYAFDPGASAMELLLSVTDGCGGEQITGTANGNALLLSLAAGESVFISVEGMFGTEGPWTLDVDLVGVSVPHDDSCCEGQTPGVTGCDVPSVSDCVLAVDVYCGGTDGGYWDPICAYRATGCGMDCD